MLYFLLLWVLSQCLVEIPRFIPTERIGTFSFNSCRKKLLKTTLFPSPTLKVAHTNFSLILIMPRQESNENVQIFSAEVKLGFLFRNDSRN
jgi:hypothetical protein